MAGEGRLNVLEGRLANLIRDGVVTHVDPDRGVCRLRIGGTVEQPLLSPWVRYEQVAGKLSLHLPPSVGQQMRLTSPAGDWRQGLARAHSATTDNPSPGTGPDPVLTYGAELRIELSDEGLTVTAGAATLALRTDKIEIGVGSSVLTLVDGKATLKADLVVTDGETRLNKGTRDVVYKGSVDTNGGVNNQAASGVKV